MVIIENKTLNNTGNNIVGMLFFCKILGYFIRAKLAANTMKINPSQLPPENRLKKYSILNVYSGWYSGFS